MKVNKIISTISISEEALQDHVDLWSDFRRWREATPEEREQWRQEESARRGIERERAFQVELTLDRLLERLHISTTFATHLLQPYCSCDMEDVGWTLCQHARDLGIEP